MNGNGDDGDGDGDRDNIDTAQSPIEDFLGGIGSWFRGLYRLLRFDARLVGAMGPQEKLRAELEDRIFNQLLFKEIHRNE